MQDSAILSYALADLEEGGPRDPLLCYPLGSDLSGGYHYSLFEQPAPGLRLQLVRLNRRKTSMRGNLQYK